MTAQPQEETVCLTFGGHNMSHQSRLLNFLPLVFILLWTKPLPAQIPPRIDEHLGELKALVERWNNAAQKLAEGKLKEAVEIMKLDPPSDIGWTIVQRHRDLRWELESWLGHGRPSDLWVANKCKDIEASETACRLYEKCFEAEKKPEFADTFGFSQCLAEAGKYREAEEVLRTLRQGKIESDWAGMIDKRLALLQTLQKCEAGSKDRLEALRQFYADVGPEWYRNRIIPILQVAEYLQGPHSMTAQDALLVLFEKARDQRGTELLLRHIAEAGGGERAASALLTLGTHLFEAKDMNGARSQWQKILDSHVATSAWPKALFNTALSYQQERKYDDAVKCYQRLVQSSVNDREPGGNIMEAYRNYRPRAQRGIFECQFETGKFQEALESIRTAREKYPMRSWCGTCQDSYGTHYDECEMLCRLRLGRLEEALALFLRSIASRPSSGYGFVPVSALVEAFASNNKLDKLAKDLAPHSANIPAPQLAQQLIGICRFAASKDIGALLEYFKGKGHAVPTWREYRASVDKPAGYVELYVSRIIAGLSGKAVTLLVKRFQELSVNRRVYNLECSWLFFTLALCKDQSATAYIESHFFTKPSFWDIPKGEDELATAYLICHPLPPVVADIPEAIKKKLLGQVLEAYGAPSETQVDSYPKGHYDDYDTGLYLATRTLYKSGTSVRFPEVCETDRFWLFSISPAGEENRFAAGVWVPKGDVNKRGKWGAWPEQK